MSYIILDHVTKMFNKDKVGVQDITLKIEKGEFIFLVGKSGAGKSTLIKLLSREYKPTSGFILIDNENLNEMSAKKIPFHRRKVCVISQDAQLLSYKTVYENIEFAMLATEQPEEIIKDAVWAALSVVGIKDKANRYPNELSGGEKTRVTLARAIVNRPDIIIADEPTSNLDNDTSWDIMCLFKEINQIGLTVLVSTHAKELVNIMRKRVVTLSEGKLIGDVKKGKYDDTISELQFQTNYGMKNWMNRK